MHQRILDIHFRHVEEFERVFHDAATPPYDRREWRLALRALDESHDPRTMLRTVRAHPLLLEFVVRGSTSGHQYGMLLMDMGHVADAIAYWREPPLVHDPTGSHQPGTGRAKAILRALRRLRELT